VTSPRISESLFQESELSSRSFRFGGYKATSQAIVWPILLLLSLNISSSGISDDPESRLILLRSSAAALIVAGLYFTVLGAIINFLLPRLGRPRTWLIGILYATTELVRAALIQLFAEASGLVTNPQWGFRIVAALTTGIIVFALVSTVVNDSAIYRESYKELATQRFKLRSVIEASLDNLVRARDQLIKTTREQLSLALKSTLSETEKLAPQFPLIIQNLFSVAEEVVRPLSHSLFENPLMLSANQLEAQAPRVPITTVIRKSSLAAPFRPGLITVMAALLSLPSVLLDLSLIYTFQWALALVFIYASNALARKFLAPHLSSIPLFIRIVFISIVYAVPAIFFVQVALNSDIVQDSVISETILYGSLLGFVLGWLIASSAGMRTARIEMLSEISQINDDLAWQNARIQSELWLDQKSLALTLHNDVQATLLAAALKLKATVDASPDSAAEALPEIKDLITRSINFGSTALREFTLSSIIQRINDNWAGIITMRFTASGETLNMVENDPVAMGILEDVLSEFQNNSLKHGHSTETTAILSSPQRGILQVAMTNNGERLSAETQNGLGSAFLKSVALDYKLENFTRGVKLTVWLPISLSVEDSVSAEK
jgi:signal transduction histidine kinase